MAFFVKLQLHFERNSFEGLLNRNFWGLLSLILLSISIDSKLLANDNFAKIDDLIKFAASINSSNHQRAFQIIDSTLALCKKNNYPLGEARATRIKGLSKFYAAEYSKALELFLSSREKFEKLRDTIGIAQTNNNIAIVYSYLDMFDKSMLYHKQNLALREKIRDVEGIATTLNNIGVEFKNKNMYDSALYYYQRALAIELKRKDSVTISRYLNNIGLAYLNLNKLDSAKIYIDKGLSIRLQISELQGIKNSYQALGHYYFKLNNYAEARKFQEISMQYAYKIGIVYEIESISKDLALTYEKLNLFELAYKYSALNRKMQDSLKFTETSRQITKIELERAFENEKKLKELEAENNIQKEKANIQQLIYLISGLIIILLIIIYSFVKIRKTNRLLLIQQDEILLQKEEITAQSNSIAKQNEELEKLNLEKDKFFSIIAHDLRSPFSGFIGIANLLVNNNNSNSKEEVFELSKLLKDSAENLYKLLENLLEWSKIKGGLIDFNPEVCIIEIVVFENIQIHSELANQKQIELESTVQEGLMVKCDLRMLNSMIRNLLTNAIKFTRRGGKIEIKANKLDDNKALISITDNGIGMDETTISKLFRIDQKLSTLGTENEPSTGLGLLLVKEFVEKNKGEIWVESELEKGTTFSFTLELQQ